MGFLIYSNTFKVPFLYDDVRIISNNPSIRKPLSSLSFLQGEGSNRPLLMFSFALNYAFGRLNVFGYHIVNLIFHIINSFLVFLILHLIFKFHINSGDGGADENYSFFSSMAGALFFLCNPLATESVTYISSRSSLLSTTFFLSAFVLFILGRNKGSFLHYLLSFLLFLLGVGFKETVLVFPFITALYEIFFCKKGNKKTLSFYIPLILAVFFIVAFRYTFVFSLSSPDNTKRNIVHHILTESALIPYSLLKTFLPFNLNIDHSFSLIKSPFSIEFLLVLLVWIIIFWLLGKLSTTLNGSAFSLFWFILSLSPHLLIRLNDLYAERWLYLPMIGVSFLISELLFYFFRSRYSKHLIICTVLIVLFFSIGTFERNSIYKSEITLWKDAVKKSPLKARPHNNYGYALQKAGFVDEAIKEYLIALRINPLYIEAHNNLGAAYAEKGLYERAEYEFKRAISLKGDSPKTYNNLGMLYQRRGLLDLAIIKYKKAIRLDPSIAEVHNNLGYAYLSKGMTNMALEECKKAVELDKNFPEAYHNLGLCYEAKGMIDEAERSYEYALALNSNLLLTHIQLGKIYLKKGLREKALLHFETVLQKKPNWKGLNKVVEDLKINR
ncbi:MAG: tetratricopeptide repeat protein [Candidatus Schekmanbacteria bacterium]|nr:MAG: tetratricopeptide repeat protein [Candidatus Schekmanbacteria bacterium]